MVLFIAHRGNTRGPERPELENSVPHLQAALDQGYHVEVDVWRVDGGRLMLGHDAPLHEVDLAFLNDPRVWCHAKNVGALGVLLPAGCHVFFHDADEYTLTSRGIVWAYPGKPLLPSDGEVLRCVCVLPERARYTDVELREAGAVCSDHVEALRARL